MERHVKKEILLMLIPIIGIWWVLLRIIPDIPKIDWWVCSDKALPVIFGISFYQAFCFMGLKIINIMMCHNIDLQHAIQFLIK